jgi:hypothetical protein
VLFVTQLSLVQVFTMTARVRRLRHELAAILAVKAALLAGLWLILIRDYRVPVNTSAMAQHVLQTQAAVQKGEKNDN